MTTIVILLLIAFGLIGFVIYSKFKATPAASGTPARVWAALTGAAAAFGAAAHALFGGSPPAQ